MVIAFLADAIKKGELARFGKATAVCVVGALIGISLNLSNLYHTWSMVRKPCVERVNS